MVYSESLVPPSTRSTVFAINQMFKQLKPDPKLYDK